MGNYPFVSIITPSYNQGQYIESTIKSVLTQKYQNVEYFVIDGGSTDGSIDIIKKYAAQLAWWVSEPDLGQTDAINKGFAKAKGEILAYLNSDDTYLPNAISEAVTYLQAHPEAGMVYGDANFIDENDRVIGKFNAKQTNHKRLRRGAVYIPQQATFFRAELWHQVGPLDPSFYFAMDYDLWVRIASIAPLHYYPRLWANFRLHGDSKSITEDSRCWPEMIRIHRRDGGSWVSILIARYLLRSLLSPFIRLQRKRLISQKK